MTDIDAYFIPSMSAIISSPAKIIIKDVITQLEFNPRRIFKIEKKNRNFPEADRWNKKQKHWNERLTQR